MFRYCQSPGVFKSPRSTLKMLVQPVSEQPVAARTIGRELCSNLQDNSTICWGVIEGCVQPPDAATLEQSPVRCHLAGNTHLAPEYKKSQYVKAG